MHPLQHVPKQGSTTITCALAYALLINYYECVWFAVDFNII